MLYRLRLLLLSMFYALSLAQLCVAQDSPKTSSLQVASTGLAALQSWYVPETGLYQTTGWWNAANAITVLVDYSRLTGNKEYLPVLSSTFQHAQGKFQNFLNNYFDDEGWWALAWIDAYDLTHDSRYLDKAGLIFADMAGAWDDTCNGGIWWSKDRSYKNAIANELFLSVAAHLAVRTRDPVQRRKYSEWAEKEWRWFKASGMMNAEHLINDGLVTATCKNNGRNTWTYNQGVILGALVEMDRTKANAEFGDIAQEVADAVLTHLTDAQGVLHDTCEPTCGEDGVQFKGIFTRNLLSLQQAYPKERYAAFLRVNAHSIETHAQGPDGQFGLVWSGPFSTTNAAIQSSALDAIVADAFLSK